MGYSDRTSRSIALLYHTDCLPVPCVHFPWWTDPDAFESTLPRRFWDNLPVQTKTVWQRVDKSQSTASCPCALFPPGSGTHSHAAVEAPLPVLDRQIGLSQIVNWVCWGISSQLLPCPCRFGVLSSALARCCASSAALPPPLPHARKKCSGVPLTRRLLRRHVSPGRSYAAAEDYTVQKVTVQAAASPTASLVLLFANGTAVPGGGAAGQPGAATWGVPLAGNVTTLRVEVTAQDGTTKSDTVVVVTRAPPPPPPPSLASLVAVWLQNVFWGAGKRFLEPENRIRTRCVVHTAKHDGGGNDACQRRSCTESEPDLPPNRCCLVCFCCPGGRTRRQVERKLRAEHAGVPRAGGRELPQRDGAPPYHARANRSGCWNFRVLQA